MGKCAFNGMTTTQSIRTDNTEWISVSRLEAKHTTQPVRKRRHREEPSEYDQQNTGALTTANGDLPFWFEQ